MSERKVLNKYYPPDFDPSKIPRRSGPKNSQQVVRLMAPFSMRCNTCGEYIYKGKKFNARKETVEDEDYYGIKIFRFYIKCTLCSAEITFKTDPKNTDYAAELGASRNFEPWREVEIVEEEDRLAKLEEEENDAMKVLETRTQDSKREMEILDALQDLRARNARLERVAAGGGAVDALEAQDEELDEEELRKRAEEEEDEEIVRRVFSKIPNPSTSSSAGPSQTSSTVEPSGNDSNPPDSAPSSSITIKRKADFLEPQLDSTIQTAVKAVMTRAPPPAKKKKSELASALGIKRPTKPKAAA
ncbi:CWC16 protein [Cantharellus anzutake]|uniref:CWC16 protein n=1 Tax=Cantharellus anzutake TaxID=1750568 RepID=UPI0019041F7F|nr:CWC16 protein [Cantharellus anzutake]KAF8344331.1 CWC16 protein [Cantharellus anzutake]